MLGAEVDINWADIYNSSRPTNASEFTIGASNPSVYGFREVTTNYAPDYRRVGLDWVGTVRARVGYDMGRFMPYVTGGWLMAASAARSARRNTA